MSAPVLADPVLASAQPATTLLTPAVLVGAGLVGASVGCALTRVGVSVHLRDLVPSHAVVAASRGAGTIDPVDAADVRLVVVAVPPRALTAEIAAALDEFPAAVVTDVGSVKGRLAHDLRHHPHRARYVGSHPMAGSQFTGPLTADADLFVDRSWVVTPTAENTPEAVEVVRALVRACGAKLIEMDAVQHDTAVAQVSHLPHLMSVLTAGHLTQVPGEHLRLAGPGVRDVTRIAGSDPAMWEQILTTNADAVRDELSQVHQRLGELLDGLGKPGAVQAFLERGNAGIRALPGKHGTPPAAYEHVIIEIPDAPGALARLFSQVESAGVNVEDLAIEHDPDRQLGYLSIAVAAHRVESLRAAMTSAGWTVRA